MAETARKLSLASTHAGYRPLAPANRGPVRLRPLPSPAQRQDRVDLSAKAERHRYRARFWQMALPGLAVFWGGVAWLVVA